MRDEGIIKDRIEAILKEVQTIISIFYILMVGIGMLFEYQRYKLFGINIFDYADVFDFLIAPFKSPLIFLFIFLSLSIAYFVFRSDLYIQQKWPKFYRISSFGWDKKSWYGNFRLFTIAFLFITYIFFSSNFLAQKFESNFKKKDNTIRIIYTDDSFSQGKMIGKTNDTIFLWSQNQVKIIPTNSLVKEIHL